MEKRKKQADKVKSVDDDDDSSTERQPKDPTEEEIAERAAEIRRANDELKRQSTSKVSRTVSRNYRVYGYLGNGVFKSY